jgi:hypothetical protein
MNVYEKSAAEEKVYTFDFTDAIGALSLTGSPTVVGVPSGLTIGTPAIVGKTVTATISGGTAGTEYALTCSAVATGSLDYQVGAVLRIREVPPAATDGITTVARVVSELGITTEAQQALVADWILDATAAVEKYLGYALKQQTFTEKVAGYEGQVLQLKNRPLVSITSITFDGVALDADDYFIHNSINGQVWIDTGVNSTAARYSGTSRTALSQPHDKLYTVVYVAGYVMPGVATRTLPRDIERAGIELVRGYMNARSNPDVKREAVDGVYSVEYFDRAASVNDLSSLPQGIVSMLSQYRAVAL